MPRKRLIVAAAVPLVIGVLLLGAAVVRVVKQAALERAVEDLRSQATTQAKNRQFVHAADTFERLQVLCMDSGRYQEALDASRTIEDVSRHIPGAGRRGTSSGSPRRTSAWATGTATSSGCRRPSTNGRSRR